MTMKLTADFVNYSARKGVAEAAAQKTADSMLNAYVKRNGLTISEATGELLMTALHRDAALLKYNKSAKGKAAAKGKSTAKPKRAAKTKASAKPKKVKATAKPKASTVKKARAPKASKANGAAHHAEAHAGI